MDKDNELQEFVPGILETREQFEARKKAVMANPNPTMFELAQVGMDDSADFKEVRQLLAEMQSEKEAERNKAIAEAAHRPDKE